MRFIILASFSLFLSACASFQSYSHCDIATDSGLPILHPQSFAVNLISTQQISLITEQQNFEFIAQLEINSERMILVSLTPIGQKLFQIQYSRGQLDFQRFGIPDTFNPAFLLTDISLVYGRGDILEKCFVQTRLPIQISQNTSQKRIMIIDGDAIEIQYSTNNPWQSEIELNNPARGYKIKIKPLALENL